MSSRFSCWLRLTAGSGLILIVWLVLLPAIGRQPQIQSRIDFLNEQGIDPSAMYYTDLEVMSEVEERVTTLQKEHPDAFWQP